MATKINMKHSQTGLLKEVPVGFSWTTLFFGFFPALFRDDIKWCAIWLVVAMITFGVSVLVFPFFYNKIYARSLLESGYTPADDFSKSTLSEHGLHTVGD